MGVSKNRGTPKWMVKIMENPYEQMDDLGGISTPIFGSTPKWHHLMNILTLSSSTAPKLQCNEGPPDDSPRWQCRPAW